MSPENQFWLQLHGLESILALIYPTGYSESNLISQIDDSIQFEVEPDECHGLMPHAWLDALLYVIRLPSLCWKDAKRVIYSVSQVNTGERSRILKFYQNIVTLCRTLYCSPMMKIKCATLRQYQKCKQLFCINFSILLLTTWGTWTPRFTWFFACDVTCMWWWIIDFIASLALHPRVYYWFVRIIEFMGIMMNVDVNEYMRRSECYG